MVDWKFESIRNWPDIMDFVRKIFVLCRGLPLDESNGLTRQMKNAAMNVPVNIAAGRAYKDKKEFSKFLIEARMHLYKTVVCLKLASDLEYIPGKESATLQEDAEQILKLLNGMIRYLEKS